MIELHASIGMLFPADAVAVFLHAHPDDESFLSAGVICELCETGRTVLVVYAAAAVVDGFQQTVVRQAEAEAARVCLGGYAVRYLPFCEPKYAGRAVSRLIDQAPEDVARSLREVIAAETGRRPYVMVSYDRHGGYGNRDHIVLHSAGRIALETDGFECCGFYEVTINRSAVSAWIREASLRLPAPDLPNFRDWAEAFGLEEQEIDVRYLLTSEKLSRKRDALATHASQTKRDEFPLSLSEWDFRAVFGYEYLKRVR